MAVSCLGKLTDCSPELIHHGDAMLSERRSDRLAELEIKKRNLMGAGKNALIIFSFGTDANLPLRCLKVSYTKQRQRDLIRSEGDDEVNFVFFSPSLST